MTAFISKSNLSQGFYSEVTIDGSAEGVKKTTLSDGSAVQLRRARTEESGFDWFRGTIKKVVAKNVLIYDGIDIACLNWFIETKVEVDLSDAYVSHCALDNLVEMVNDLKRRKIKVIEGSSIGIPILGGFSGMGRSEEAKYACESIGFKVFYS